MKNGLKIFSLYFVTGCIAIATILGVRTLLVKADTIYTIKPGDTLTKISKAFNVAIEQLASDNNILNINKIVSGKKLTITDGPVLGTAGGGYVPITGYESRTTQYITASAATIPVASTKDPSGTQIDLTNISPSGTVNVYMSLEPGTTREEPIKCTGVTALSWTGCTRGLPFQGGSETASSTLQKAHNAGSKIIITNVGQFYNQYVSLDGPQTVYGIKSFSVFPGTTSTTALPTANNQFVTKYYADTVVSTGFTSANIDATTGLKAAGTSPEKVQINASSTGSIAFDSNGKLYVNPTFNSGVLFNSTTTFVATTTQNGDVIYASSSSMFRVNPYGDGSDGDVTISANTTNTRDMFYNNLTLSGAAINNTGGYRIFVKGKLTRSGTAKITNNGGAGGAGGAGSGGGAGTAGTAGTAPAGVTVPLPAAAVAGVAGVYQTVNGKTNGNNGLAGNSLTNTIASSTTFTAGAGGNGTSVGAGTATGGTKGTDSTSTQTTAMPRSLLTATTLSFPGGTSITLLRPSAGSPSGGSGGASTDSSGVCGSGGSGGSGAPGGMIWIAARSILDIGTGTMFEAKGGDGGAGGAGGGAGTNNYGCGGGAAGVAGGGGVVVKIYDDIQGTVTSDVSAGTGGAVGTGTSNGTGSATNGAAASAAAAGLTLNIQL